MRAIVCGGRDYGDKARVYEVLDAIRPTYLILGGATGADTLARQWAHDRLVEGVILPANWKRDGRKAGPLRNQRMLEKKPDLVIAFPGGRGTADMIARAEKAGAPVYKVPA